MRRLARRILLVDDSVVVRRVLALVLRQIRDFERAEFDEAANGLQALRKMQDGPFDLVISDIRMPVLDGLAFVEKVRREMGDQVTPIVMISTLGSEADVKRGMDAGATAYICKPIVPNEIRTEFSSLLRSGQLTIPERS